MRICVYAFAYENRKIHENFYSLNIKLRFGKKSFPMATRLKIQFEYHFSTQATAKTRCDNTAGNHHNPNNSTISIGFCDSLL